MVLRRPSGSPQQGDLVAEAVINSPDVRFVFSSLPFPFPNICLSTLLLTRISNMDKNLVIYSLENSIQEFFSTQTTVAKAECDAKAASLVGEPVNPVSVQGECSYTVTAGPDQAQTVQFRNEESALNLTHLDLARQAHLGYVPRYTYHGKMGGGQQPLSVFVMEKCIGTCYIVSIDRSSDGRTDFETRQLQTVRDLAR